MSAGAKFYFKPASEESIETSININPEKNSAIFGTVYSRTGGSVPVEGAMVLLFTCGDAKKLIDIQFTDEDGQFYFGPIESGVLHLIKVYKNSIKLRELEIAPE